MMGKKATQAAFPSPGVVLASGHQQGAYEGMSLRDYFAAHISDIQVDHAMASSLSSLESKEQLAGRPRPTPSDDLKRGKIGAADEVTYPLDLLAWHCEVRAGLRYMMAEAMVMQKGRQ